MIGKKEADYRDEKGLGKERNGEREGERGKYMVTTRYVYVSVPQLYNYTIIMYYKFILCFTNCLYFHFNLKIASWLNKTYVFMSYHSVGILIYTDSDQSV